MPSKEKGLSIEKEKIAELLSYLMSGKTGQLPIKPTKALKALGKGTMLNAYHRVIGR